MITRKKGLVFDTWYVAIWGKGRKLHSVLSGIRGKNAPSKGVGWLRGVKEGVASRGGKKKACVNGDGKTALRTLKRKKEGKRREFVTQPLDGPREGGCNELILGGNCPSCNKGRKRKKGGEGEDFQLSRVHCQGMLCSVKAA